MNCMDILRRSASRVFWNCKIYKNSNSSCILHKMGIGFSSTNYSSSPRAFTFINSIIHQNCVVIFSKTDCPYSKMAKKVFNSMGIPYHTVELNLREDGEELQHALMELTGVKTVPRIFINGSCIGGGIETKNLHKEGKLESLLEKCSHKNSELKSSL